MTRQRLLRFLMISINEYISPNFTVYLKSNSKSLPEHWNFCEVSTYHFKNSIFPKLFTYPRYDCSVTQSGRDVNQDDFNPQINSKSVCCPLFIWLRPRTTITDFLCCSDASIYASRKKTRHTTLLWRWSVGCFMDLWCAYTRNSMKAKSKANNRTHVLKLFA